MKNSNRTVTQIGKPTKQEQKTSDLLKEWKEKTNKFSLIFIMTYLLILTGCSSAVVKEYDGVVTDHYSKTIDGNNCYGVAFKNIYNDTLLHEQKCTKERFTSGEEVTVYYDGSNIKGIMKKESE